MAEFRGRVAVVGVGEDGVGTAVPGSTPLDLVARATRVALADAGLQMRDVDGLFTASAYYQLPSLNVSEYLGLRPRSSDSTAVGGSSFVAHVGHAAAAIAAGLCEVALMVYGSTQRSDSGRLVSQAEGSPYERPYRPRYPVTMYALAAARHMHQYGTTREQLAEVAVAARQWAQLHPGAFVRDPLTVDDVLSSRMVPSPLTVYLLELYDAFTSSPSCSSRTSASARRGRAASSSPRGRSRPEVACRSTPTAGGLSYCHPGMYRIFALVEAVRQLRGEAGARQVPGDVGLVHGNGGVLSSQVTAIFGPDRRCERERDQMSLYYEDLDVGQVLRTPARTVTETDLVGFWMLSGDWNAIHSDEEFASATFYGQRVVHGLFGMALLTGLMERAGWFSESAVAMLGIERWTFQSPIVVGDTLRCEMEVLDKRLTSKGDRGIVSRRFTLRNQRDAVVQTGEVGLVIKTSPEVAA